MCLVAMAPISGSYGGPGQQESFFCGLPAANVKFMEQERDIMTLSSDAFRRIITKKTEIVVHDILP